jgi:hypothetical protein
LEATTSPNPSFSTYRLVGLDVTTVGHIGRVMARILSLARRLDIEAPVLRLLRSRVASHTIYAFSPRSRL